MSERRPFDIGDVSTWPPDAKRDEALASVGDPRYYKRTAALEADRDVDRAERAAELAEERRTR